MSSASTGNLKAFLDTIAISELLQPVLDGSDNGYNVLVGSTPEHIDTFPSYADHPRVMVYLPNIAIHSSAAGRYQILAHNYDYYKKFLSLPDFSPASQDEIATQLIRECDAMNNIVAGNVKIAIAECSRIWASFPGNSYGQRQRNLDQLCQTYVSAGGGIA